MEYLALEAHWLPVHASALDPYAGPCPSFFPHRLTHRVSTIGRCIIATSFQSISMTAPYKFGSAETTLDMAQGEPCRIGSMST